MMFYFCFWAFPFLYYILNKKGKQLKFCQERSGELSSDCKIQINFIKSGQARIQPQQTSKQIYKTSYFIYHQRNGAFKPNKPTPTWFDKVKYIFRITITNSPIFYKGSQRSPKNFASKDPICPTHLPTNTLFENSTNYPMGAAEIIFKRPNADET